MIVSLLLRRLLQAALTMFIAVLAIFLAVRALPANPVIARFADPEVVMEAIRTAKLSLPDTVDPPLGQIIRKALARDVDSRYRTAGEFAGELLTWALDSGNSPSRHNVQSWLMKTLSYAGL